MRQTVGVGLDIGVGQPPIAEGGGDRPRLTIDLTLEELVHAPVLVEGVIRAVPVDDDLPALLVGEHRELPDPTVGVADDALEQRGEVPAGGCDRALVEEVAGILELSDQFVGRPRHPQREIELSVLLRHSERLEPEAGAGDAALSGRRDEEARQLRRGLGPQEGEGRLAQRGPAGVTGGSELLDHQREREVLVPDRPAGRVVDLAEERAEGRVSGEVGPDGEHVHAEADQRREPGVGASRGGGAHDDAGLPAVAMQQDGKRGEEQPEHRRLLLPGEGHRPGRRPGVDDEGDGPASEGLHRGPGPVGRQLQHR
jgi:hypothetical protein